MNENLKINRYWLIQEHIHPETRIQSKKKVFNNLKYIYELTMCDQCEVEVKGRRSVTGTPIFSILFGSFACKHTNTCLCENCKKYRHRNEYADTGLFLNQEDKV